MYIPIRSCPVLDKKSLQFGRVRNACDTGGATNVSNHRTGQTGYRRKRWGVASPLSCSSLAAERPSVRSCFFPRFAEATETEGQKTKAARASSRRSPHRRQMGLLSLNSSKYNHKRLRLMFGRFTVSRSALYTARGRRGDPASERSVQLRIIWWTHLIKVLSHRRSEQLSIRPVISCRDYACTSSNHRIRGPVVQ